jgi:hypothetical protein
MSELLPNDLQLGDAPAYPVLQTLSGHVGMVSAGLTKRELFAAMAMQGLCANPGFADINSHAIASYATNQADALLAALKEST